MRRCTLSTGPLLLLVTFLLPAGPLPAQSVISPPASIHLASWPVSVRPNDIAASSEDGTIAVLDAGNSAIEFLRPGGTHMEFRRGFRDPRSIAFLPGNVLLVGEAESGTVKGYDGEGRVVLTLGSPHGEFSTPNDIAVHPVTGRIYVVDSAANAIRAYRSSDGGFEFQFGTAGTGPGELRFPISAAVNADLGEVFVGDSRNRRVAVFDAETGAFRRNIAGAGGGDGEISFVGGLFTDSDFRLFTVESLGGFVQILDPDGGFVGRIGDHGRGEGQLRSPKAVLIDRYNRLLVTSFLDRKIEVWGLDDFENPVDQEIAVFANGIPAHINPDLPAFKVVFQVQGVDPAEIDPATLRLNGVVPPLPDSYRLGPHLSVRFSTPEVLATLPSGFRGDTILVLSGATLGGAPFEGDVAVAVVPPPVEPPNPGGGKG